MALLNVRGVLIGRVATVTMDLLTLGALKPGLVAPLSPHLVGRWFATMARPSFHGDIVQAPPVAHEVAIAVPVHYAIGTTLALVDLFSAAAIGLSPRQAAAALAFGLGTSILAWLVMFPSMGYGFLRRPRPGGHPPLHEQPPHPRLLRDRPLARSVDRGVTDREDAYLRRN
jgi:hypothetical protein